MKVKIGDLTKIRTGKLDANASSEDGQYPFFTCSKEPLKISTYSYDCECVLVAGNGDLNVKYYNGKFDAYQRTYIIEDNGSGKLFMPYLYYFMEGYVEELRKQAIGGVIKYIKLGNLTDALIEIPSVDEQKAIVDILEKAKNVLDMRNEEISKLDDLIKARFVEMFGEYYKNHINEKQLDEICDFIDYRGKTPEKSESGIPLITAKNVKDNRFSIEPQEFIPEENYDDVMTRGIPRVNDVLFTTEAPLGNVCRIPDVYERFCVGQRLITMQPHTDVINPEYLEHALTSAEFQEKMWQKSSGSTVKGIRSKLLVLLTIPVPPIELQNQFRDFLKQVDKSKVVVQKSLDETQQLFDSLMQKYFG